MFLPESRISIGCRAECEGVRGIKERWAGCWGEVVGQRELIFHSVFLEMKATMMYRYVCVCVCMCKGLCREGIGRGRGQGSSHASRLGLTLRAVSRSEPFVPGSREPCVCSRSLASCVVRTQHKTTAPVPNRQ